MPFSFSRVAKGTPASVLWKSVSWKRIAAGTTHPKIATDKCTSAAVLTAGDPVAKALRREEQLPVVAAVLFGVLDLCRAGIHGKFGHGKNTLTLRRLTDALEALANGAARLVRGENALARGDQCSLHAGKEEYARAI